MVTRTTHGGNVHCSYYVDVDQLLTLNSYKVI